LYQCPAHRVNEHYTLSWRSVLYSSMNVLNWPLILFIYPFWRVQYLWCQDNYSDDDGGVLFPPHSEPTVQSLWFSIYVSRTQKGSLLCAFCVPRRCWCLATAAELVSDFTVIVSPVGFWYFYLRYNCNIAADSTSCGTITLSRSYSINDASTPHEPSKHGALILVVSRENDPTYSYLRRKLRHGTANANLCSTIQCYLNFLFLQTDGYKMEPQWDFTCSQAQGSQ
jgi:hypothetical protein